MIFRWYYLLNSSILWEEGKKQKESWLVANLSIDFCLRLLFSSSRSSSTRTTKKEKSLTIDLKFPSILIVFLISSVKCRTPWAPITFQARFLLLTNVYYQTDTLVLGQKKEGHLHSLRLAKLNCWSKQTSVSFDFNIQIRLSVIRSMITSDLVVFLPSLFEDDLWMCTNIICLETSSVNSKEAHAIEYRTRVALSFSS